MKIRFHSRIYIKNGCKGIYFLTNAIKIPAARFFVVITINCGKYYTFAPQNAQNAQSAMPL
jgi:hypothetical protein